MTVLSTAAALALALQCVGSSLAPVMVGIAQHESGLDPAAVHRNANGTVDVGLAQVNSSNFGWLGLTMLTALDPCRSLRAGARVLLARYNGNPPDVGKVAYARAVTARIAALDSAAALPPPTDHTEPQPPAWDLEAVAEWRRRPVPTAEDAPETDEPSVAIVEPTPKQGADSK